MHPCLALMATPPMTTGIISVPETVISVPFEDQPRTENTVVPLYHTPEQEVDRDALTLLSHLKTVIFSTYKRNRPRIKWALRKRVKYAEYCFFQR